MQPVEKVQNVLQIPLTVGFNYQIWYHTWWPLSRKCEISCKFQDISLTFCGTPAQLSVTHIMPVLVLLSVVGVGMQQCMVQNQNKMHKLSKVKNGCKYTGNNKQF